MGRVTPRRPEQPAEPPAPPGEEAPPEPRRPARGWRFALALWAVAFGSLCLFEVGKFLWQVLRRLF